MWNLKTTKSGVAQRLGLLGFSAALAVGAGCGNNANDAKNVGMVELSILQVPEDVACVRVNAVGTRSIESDFDVKPGQPSVLAMSAVPVGEVRFNASAFPGACAAVGAGASASWLGEPVVAKIVPGQLARVLIALRPNGRSLVGVDFIMDDRTGELCVGDEPGCLSPADATGKASDPIPDGARMISSPEFGRALNEGTVHLSSSRIVDAAQKEEDAESKRARKTLTTLLEQNQIPVERVLRPVALDDRMKPLGDGNYLLTIATNDGKETQSVVTYGERFAISEALKGIEQFPTQANQYGIYASIFENVSPELRRQLQLPDPRELIQVEATELLKLNTSVTAQLLEINQFQVLDLPPAGYPASCAAEEGAPANLTDQTGGSCSPKSNGIWQQYRFPLKWFATCVKNQASRGTCVSFGITAATEAALAVKHSRWTNLSEQRLYYWAKQPTLHGDGLNTSGTMSDMISTAFTFPFETRWDYNPSSSRTTLDFGVIKLYTQSCNGYTGEHCSDTSHQGDSVCVDVGAIRYCGYDGSVSATSGFRMTSNLQLFSLFGTTTGVDLAKLFLGLKIPLVMALDVTPSFDNASSTGIATYVGPIESSRGGHAVSVMGFVDNANLPSGVAPGSGGGYFIVKNSWGKCWKDGGYVYLPYDWVKQHAYMLSTVNVN